MVAVCRFVDHDMMMRYHWGHGVGHMYAFTESDPGQEKLVDDGDGGKSCDTAKMDDGSGNDSDSFDDGDSQHGNVSDVDCDDSDEENQCLVNAMYDSDSHESSRDREYSF